VSALPCPATAQALDDFIAVRTAPPAPENAPRVVIIADELCLVQRTADGSLEPVPWTAPVRLPSAWRQALERARGL
jgi:hypothetical protein